MIRFIIETVSSKIDRNGNRYHFAVITSTRTGKYLRTEIGGPSNAAGLLRKAGLDWTEIHSTNCEIGYRDWQRANKSVNVYEHNCTLEMIQALEGEAGGSLAERDARIVAVINEFDRRSNADQHTDTGEVWDLFDMIRDELKP